MPVKTGIQSGVDSIDSCSLDTGLRRRDESIFSRLLIRIPAPAPLRNAGLAMAGPAFFLPPLQVQWWFVVLVSATLNRDRRAWLSSDTVSFRHGQVAQACSRRALGKRCIRQRCALRA